MQDGQTIFKVAVGALALLAMTVEFTRGQWMPSEEAVEVPQVEVLAVPGPLVTQPTGQLIGAKLAGIHSYHETPIVFAPKKYAPIKIAHQARATKVQIAHARPAPHKFQPKLIAQKPRMSPFEPIVAQPYTVSYERPTLKQKLGRLWVSLKSKFHRKQQPTT
jgi:hypothetical protein